MLIDDYNYFDNHREDLAELYPDKWLLIKDRIVLFAVQTLKEAYQVSKEKGIKEGDCLIDFCYKDGKKRVFKVRQSFISSSLVGKMNLTCVAKAAIPKWPLLFPRR